MRRFSQPKRSNRTAGELLKQRERDPQYQDRLQEQERQRIAAGEEFKAAVAPLMAELASCGYDIGSLAALAQSDAYKNTVPILTKWLVKTTNPLVKETIIRALSVPWASDAARVLVTEFRNTPDSANTGLKWTIGSALEILADDEISDDLIDLIEDKRHGIARQMLAIALGKTKNPRAMAVLIKLLEDDEVSGHAIIGLRKLNAKECLPTIERFINHPKAWIRREAKKTVNKLKDMGH
ncbi:HEAT repeat domain-containing protein [Pedosphaera parvula]|uniref:PBS lyase HEAT domain protein repeat-containing protein n=1 Tax=Pedosphaera parvula (strain Ellin514) TaxID=320771 RepID=B9XL58_PEDPL|nr:HEAT repeat domain-containing protein [Pedosphaera parvula]EEF59409.1 PBS lyase HEAT domain protein repeat-containing protein [Pedosphaera parvula Ellin514]